MARGHSYAVIGIGTMGEVVLSGILRSKTTAPGNVHAVTRSEEKARAVRERFGVRAGTDALSAAREAKTVILCLKPPQILPLLRRLSENRAASRGQLYISIAAGVPLAEMEEALGGVCAVLRAMPNTPCSVGRGTTVFARGAKVGEAHLALAGKVFGVLGDTLVLEEKHFNTVTGLSGSGPAFAYVMIEALADGGVMMGLPRDVAIRLAARTLLGAAEMVLQTGTHPAALKDDVTTPAGCTIGGILALEDGRIRSTLARGVERAARLAAGLGLPPAPADKP